MAFISQRAVELHIAKEHTAKDSIKTKQAKNLKNHLCDLCGYSGSNVRQLELHKMRKHSVHLCDKCDFQCTVRYDLVRHQKNVHRITCNGCKMDLSSRISPEDHECPKILGPGKPSQEELEKLNLVKTNHRFLKKTSEGNYICLECGLCNSQKRFMMSHIYVSLDIQYAPTFVFLFHHFF